jgi:uncharacterized protein (TIGR03067 family)
MFRSLRLAALLVIVAACARPAQGPPAIEGTWTVASAVLGGRTLPAAVFGNSPLVLVAGRYQFQTDSGEYRILPDASPAALDVIGRKGPNAGKTIPTIFTMQGDTLVIAYDLSATARPTTFTSEAGSRVFLARYVRASK